MIESTQEKPQVPNMAFIQALREQLVQSLLISGKGVFYLDSNN